MMRFEMDHRFDGWEWDPLGFLECPTGPLDRDESDQGYLGLWPGVCSWCFLWYEGQSTGSSIDIVCCSSGRDLIGNSPNGSYLGTMI